MSLHSCQKHNHTLPFNNAHTFLSCLSCYKSKTSHRYHLSKICRIWILTLNFKTREENCEASVSVAFFFNTNEKCHLPLITSVFITGRVTGRRWILTLPGIIAYKAQSLGYSNIAPLQMQTHELHWILLPVFYFPSSSSCTPPPPPRVLTTTTLSRVWTVLSRCSFPQDLPPYAALSFLLSASLQRN